MITILPGSIINFTVGLKGSYILFIRINEEILIILQNKEIELKSGYYLYIGSAFGAGGLASRLHRHIRKSKKKHWHIDQVTMSKSTSIEGIGVSIGKNIECQISSKLLDTSSFEPIVGFGNSDCKSCPSHFFHFIDQ